MDIDKIFKTNFRACCRKNKIRVKDVVEGTGLTVAQVNSAFNPHNQKHVPLDTAVRLARYLRKETDSIIGVDFLLDDHPTREYLEIVDKASKHLTERAETLKYVVANHVRLAEEQNLLKDYFDQLSDKFKNSL